eukprot:585360-Pelagomonas_calceolata.AAC.2
MRQTSRAYLDPRCALAVLHIRRPHIFRRQASRAYLNPKCALADSGVGPPTTTYESLNDVRGHNSDRN